MFFILSLAIYPTGVAIGGLIIFGHFFSSEGYGRRVVRSGEKYFKKNRETFENLKD